MDKKTSNSKFTRHVVDVLTFFSPLRRRKCRHLSGTACAHAQLLPVEALLLIFSNLPVVPLSLMEFENSDAHHSLLSAIQVCRSWYTAGTMKLYSSIFLRSHERVSLLMKSLQKRPKLAGLIQNVCLVDLDNERFGDIQPRYIRFLHKVQERRRRLFENSEPIPVSFLKRLSQDSHIRQLVLIERLGYQSRIRTSPSDISYLTGLEVLSFQGCRFLSPTIDLPHLPRLHTLQLSKCSVSQRRYYNLKTFHITHALFPSLQTLQIFDSSESIRVDASCLERLSKLQFIGHVESSMFSSGPSSQIASLHRATQLREFAIAWEDDPTGISEYREVLSMLGRIPEGVEKLVLVVRMTYWWDWGPTGGLSDAEAVKELCRIIEVEGRLSRLKEIRFLREAPRGMNDGSVEVLAGEVEKLRLVCVERGIMFSIVDGDANRWMEEELLAALLKG